MWFTSDEQGCQGTLVLHADGTDECEHAHRCGADERQHDHVVSCDELGCACSGEAQPLPLAA
jgi:hypothetical protein